MAFTAKDLERALGNPNVRQFLDVIAMAEGTDQHGYATAFGGGKIADLSDHPRQLHDFTQTDGQRNKTSAAGRYQFLQGTWDDVAGKLGLTDFSPKSQDLAAVELLRRNGALPALMKGDFDTAVQRSGQTWASLPSSPYAQPKRDAGFIARALDKSAQALLPAAQAGTVPGQSFTGVPDDQLLAGLKPKASAPMDFSAMTDDDLLSGLTPRGAPDFSGMSDDELLAGLSEPATPDSIGRQLGLTARAGLSGVTALPNMLWNGPAGVVNWLAGEEVVPKADSNVAADWMGLPKPQNRTERLAQDVAGAMAGAGSMARGAAELGTRAVNPVVQRVGALLADQPLLQAVSGATAGGSSGLVREVGAGPVGQTVAGLVGGVAPSAGMALGQAVARPLAPLVSQNAAQRSAGQRLAGMADTTSDALAVRLHGVGDDLVPGSAPTTAQALGDTALLAAERARRSNRPEFNTAFTERTAQQNAARVAALDEISPVIKPIHDAGNDVGATIRGAFDDNYAGMRQQVREAYAPIVADDAATMALPKETAHRIVQKYFGQGSGGPDAELGALVSDLADLPDNVPFATLQNLKSRAGEMQSKAKAAFDNRKAAAAGEVHAALDAVPDEMVQLGAIGPDRAAQFEAAKALRRSQADRFETGPARGMLRQGSDRADYLQGAEIPRAFFNNRPTSLADIRQFGKAVGNRAEATQALRDYAVTGLHDFATKGGTQAFRPTDFKRWLDSHGPALKELFSEKHLKQLGAIADDLTRAARSNTVGKAPGSDTAMNLSHSTGWQLLLDRFPVSTRVIAGAARALSNDRVGVLLDRALLDPEFAQALLAPITARNKNRLADILARGMAGATAGTAAAVEQ
ncbi:glycoside hydrolase family 104 protein [Neopusillimonas maritima]|uniref:Lysozyme n=1 Tax=Neopusillimonas maritima TaxID=2026239 RepID=A0ABX9MZT4_9BURK|nr:glycoside hydrolase family 104 protein [Neopusillimonas maritima]RII84352.1 hypothetical protein CJO09_03835 [Neopusillimonas maritima]